MGAAGFGIFPRTFETDFIEFYFRDSIECRPSRYSERVGGRLGKGVDGWSVVIGIGSGGAAVVRLRRGEDSAHPVHAAAAVPSVDRSSDDLSVCEICN